ncbi:hypothetical protein HR060_15380 [Catenovulum sp. SM1970]|uniref:hypothetical protein n=1 Tax=Marinifaba aquimaris TaxID=2741323 RepID=UPI0015722C30|nr:hypothetical protein [Marinifaba aquimaris]NTS78233.1 hypothetical protein [Marinifaba aquimaris]
MLCALPAWAQDWQLKYHHQGLKLFKGEKNFLGIRQYKVVLNVSATADDFINLLLTTDKAHLWIAGCERVELIDQIDEFNHKVNIYFSSPWPIKDRQLATYSVIQKHSDKHYTITIRRLDEPGIYENDYVAIPYFNAHYTLEQNDEALTITYQVSGSAGGDIPNWLANKILKQNLLKTFKNLKKQLSN